MERANVNDPRSLEAVYGRTEFEKDAARNAKTDAAVHYGLRIESAPDEEGWFKLVRASHHVGEARGQHSLFLFPYHPSAGSAGPGDEAAGGREGSPAEHAEDYEAFLERVLEAARTAQFPGPIGRGEERLKGFHGG